MLIVGFGILLYMIVFTPIKNLRQKWNKGRSTSLWEQQDAYERDLAAKSSDE